MSLRRVIFVREHLLLVQSVAICAIGFLANGYSLRDPESGNELWGTSDTFGEILRGVNLQDYRNNARDRSVGTGTGSHDAPLGLMTFPGSPDSRDKPDESWKGKWFPTTPSSSMHRKKELLAKDEHGRVQMGVASDQCDDGNTNLTLDWDMSPVNYTCFHPETRFPNGEILEPLLDCVDIPESYRPDHFCMDQPIHYDHIIPTHGDHRPLWPKFGEYLFVPRERWLHNIEHGAVVMLYHPCAHPMEVRLLREIVTKCYGKHVITPSNLLTHERPLALVAWGCRLQMSTVDAMTAMEFIRQKALHGPEGNYTKEGQFDKGLIHFSNASGDAVYDRVTC